MYQDFTFREFDVLTQQNSYLSAPAFAQTQFVASPDYNQMDGRFLLDIPIYHIDEVQDEFTGCCACSACGSEALKMAIIPGTDYVIDISAIDGSAGYQALMDFFAEMSGGNTSNQSGGVASMEGDTPGDATTTAVLQLDGSYTDELEVVGDRDWVAFTVTEAGRFEFNLFGSGTNELSDPYLYLRDSNGNLIAQNDDIQLGQILDSRIFATLDAGTYYLDVGAYNDSVAGEYTLTAVTAPPLRDYSIQEIAEYLREGSWTQRTHDDADQDASNGTTINYYIGDLPAGAQALAIAALEFWAEAANLDFNQVNTAAAADIDFINNEEGAFARSSVTGGTQITNVEINVASDWNGGNLDFNSYTLQTYIHEVGHALGLGHGGPYNGSANYNTDAIYLNDSWGTTVMSYFDQNESNFGTPRLVLGLQAADILAIQELYGQNTTTRTGDSVYGFNTTETGTIYDSQDWVNQGIRLPSFSIWDAGGTDTLDFSGYSANQRISLIAGTWSDVGDNTNTGDTTDPLFNLVSIAVGAVIENAIGGSGVDTITGNDVSNVLTGNGGNDILDGGDGIDYAAYSGAQSAYTVTDNGDGTFTVTHNAGGSDGTDTLSNIEFVRFSDGDVDLTAAPLPTATSGDDDFDLSTGNDTFSALDGNDTIRGLAGDDTISGDDGNDNLYGDAGDDSLNGGNGDDFIVGGIGADSLNGGIGQDRLFGQNGDDYIQGGSGDDILHGQDGADRLFGGNGNDRLYIDADDTVVNAGDGFDYIHILAGQSVTLDVAAANAEWVWGSSGADVLDASAATERVVLHGRGNVDILTGGSGGDTLVGGLRDDVLNGGDGNDRLYGQTDNDTLNGDAGNDSLYGQQGEDTINAGAGRDFIFGGTGNDTMSGGGTDLERDLFVMQTGGGNDIITDFEDGVDLIQFRSIAAVQDFGDISIANNVNGDAVITYDGSNTITLIGIDASNVTIDDFYGLNPAAESPDDDKGVLVQETPTKTIVSEGAVSETVILGIEQQPDLEVLLMSQTIDGYSSPDAGLFTLEAYDAHQYLSDTDYIDML